MTSLFRLTLFLLALLISPAFAQTDERALELLNAAEQTEPLDLDTLRMTLNMTNYTPEGDAEFTAKIRVVMDLTGRRVYQEMYFDEALTLRFTYDQGEAFMQSFYPGEEESEIRSLPAEQVEQLGEMLETIQFDPANLYPVDYDTATYDGVQSYANLITGEQVTVTVEVPAAVAPVTGQSIETRLIFGDDETLIATVQETPDAGTLLTVIEEYLERENRIIMSGMTMYTLEEEEATLWAKTRFTNLAFNEPIDDALFDLEAPVRRWLR